LKTTKTTCSSKAWKYEDRQKLRTEELNALGKAIEVLSSDTVAGASAKHFGEGEGLLQKRVGRSLAQLRSQPSQIPVAKRAAEYLNVQGARLNSHVLSAVALKIESSPFDKVIGMIKNLIDRLMEQIHDEVTHKGWCDTELATNAQTREDKSQQAEELKSKMDMLKASIATLSEEVASLSKGTAELQSSLAEADELRTKEKAENEATIKDAMRAQEAVAQATAILREFYAQAGGEPALLQQPTPPPIFEGSYTGMQDRHGGIVAMLTVILSDFARLEVDTQAAESQAQHDYDAWLTENKVNMAQMASDLKHKNAQIAKETEELASSEKDWRAVDKQLAAAVDEFNKLKPSCIYTDMTAEERAKRRQEEIDSLKEAYAILSGDAMTS